MTRNPLHWQSLDKRALQRAQMEKLRGYLRRVVLPFSAHYRDVFSQNKIDPASLRGVEDLRRIPFTSKSDLLKNNPREFVIVPEKKILARRASTIASALFFGRAALAEKFEREFRPLMMTSTTGRSSDAVPFAYTQHDIDVLAIAGNRVMRVSGASREMRMLNMFPFAPHLAFWQTHYAGTEFGVFVVSTGGGKVLGTDGNLRLIKKINPDVLIGMPTFIYHVLRAALHENVRCEKLCKIVLGGEKVPVGMRRKLRALALELGAKAVDVLPTYGFTEAKMAWPQCPHASNEAPGGYHLFPDFGIFEVIDPATGEPLPDGHAGELVWTPLEARGSVVLRYRTGDIIDGGLVFEKCPHCGRNVPRLLGNISRTSEVKEMRLDKLKGTLVDFNQLEHVLDNCEHIGTWQLEIRKANDDPLEMDELILHVQKLGSVSDEAVRERIQRCFENEMELHPNRIIFQSEEALRKMQGVGTALKEARVVDHRPAVSKSNETSGAFSNERSDEKPNEVATILKSHAAKIEKESAKYE